MDVKHKLIRSYEVTSASVHDSQVFETLLDEDNSSRDVWADSAYRSEEKLRELKKRKYREHLQRKGCRHKKLTDREAQGNRTRSRIRSRVEHVFGVQAKRAGRLIVRAIGLVRVKGQGGVEESGLQFGSILRVGWDMSAPGISTGQNDPPGSLKGDQKGDSDRFSKMNDKFFCLTFLVNSIQRNSNPRNSNY